MFPRPARILRTIIILMVVYLATSSRMSFGREFLTDKEIEKIQDAQEIDLRIKIYLDAAALRLKAAEERLNGRESEAGDPMEFYAPEDMLEGYYKILRSVMINLDDASQKSAGDRDRVIRALRRLKESADLSAKRLTVLKKIAEDKKKEYLWNLVNQAVEVTNGAREGAELGLSRETPPNDNSQKPPAENRRPKL